MPPTNGPVNVENVWSRAAAATPAATLRPSVEAFENSSLCSSRPISCVLVMRRSKPAPAARRLIELSALASPCRRARVPAQDWSLRSQSPADLVPALASSRRGAGRSRPPTWPAQPEYVAGGFGRERHRSRLRQPRAGVNGAADLLAEAQALLASMRRQAESELAGAFAREGEGVG